jgi:hypothetical protein
MKLNEEVPDSPLTRKAPAPVDFRDGGSMKLNEEVPDSPLTRTPLLQWTSGTEGV